MRPPRSREDKSALAAFFERWDRDGDGTISAGEIRTGLKAMGMDIDDQVIGRIVAECDTDGNGVIDYEEFARAFGKGVGIAAYDLEALGVVPAFPYDLSRRARIVRWAMRALSLLPYASDGVRFVALLGRHDLSAWHASVERVFGKETRYATFKKFGAFGPRTFLLRDAAMIDRALRHPEIYARAELATFRPFNVHSILGSGSGEKWLRYRVHFNPYFSEGYRDDLPALRALVTERMATWKARGEIALMSELLRIIVEVRGHILFGVRFGCYAEGPDNFAELVDRVLTPPSFPFGGDGAATNRFHGRLTEALSQCEKAGSVGLVCKTLRASGEMTEAEALQNASVYLLAQAPTMVIFWIVYRIAREGRAAALRADKTALLRAIKEELRLHPGVPTLFSRIAKVDDVNHDVRIPAGSTVYVSPSYVHRNPAAWTDAERFDPDRWSFERDDPQELTKPFTDGRDAASRPHGCPVQHGDDGRIAPRFIPFGGGQHKCQGRNFAVEEIAAVVETILAHVDLEVARDDGLLDRPLAEQLAMHVYARPTNDVTLRVRVRE